jgi:TonB-dependent receptor
MIYPFTTDSRNRIVSAGALAAGLALLLLAWLLSASPLSAQPAATGAVTGTVTNVATGRRLDGAKVEVAGLGRSTLTDGDGRFILRELPAGAHQLTVSYVDLDSARETVQVQPGGLQTVRIELTSAIYQLDAFKVTGEREGVAASITAQRNAENVKSVATIDEFGLLPNMGGGELIMRLPGAAGLVGDDGTVGGIAIRGQANVMNRITVDGGSLPPNGPMDRGFQTQFITSATFDQLELIKGHTPDKGADSLGGTINFKTRSALSMKEKRLFTYNVGATWAPAFIDHTPARRDRPVQPMISGTYNEVFSILGGERNLGVAVNGFYQDKVVSFGQSVTAYQNTTASPAYAYDYRTSDAIHESYQKDLNVRTDFRLSSASRFSLNLKATDHLQPTYEQAQVRAFTSQTIATLGANGQPTGTGAILPGFTNEITQVRGIGVPASRLDVSNTAFGFMLRSRGGDFKGEHEFQHWSFDYNAGYHQTHTNLTSGDGALAFVHSITGVGWILDRTKSDLYPRFTQTEGPDITNPANYTITSADARHIKRVATIKTFRGNAQYKFATSFPLLLKSGLEQRTQTSSHDGGNRRWNYIGAGKLPSDPSFLSWDQAKTGRRIPTWHSADFFENDAPTNPALWQENLYFREQSRYTTTANVSEKVTAGYLMSQAKLGRLGLLGGIRAERTEVSSFGWVRARVLSSAAQQTADPIGSAQRDYANNSRRKEGDYTRSFPSAHLLYDLTPDLKAHASWSTSFGRPPFTSLVPNETPNDSARTITVNNPALKPQYAKNWDASLEYYFKPIGLLSVGWFHKTITDYIVAGMDGGTVGAGPDNGYNGEYAGYGILTTTNAGTAIVQGWELSYRHQLTFLPRPFNGLGINANYTALTTHGNYGGTAYRTTREIIGFIPKVANIDLTYKYRAFSSRVLLSYLGDYITTFNATSPALSVYRYPRKAVNVGLGWQLRPSMNLFCEISNIFNEPLRRYMFDRSRLNNTSLTGTLVNAGVTGRF